jgi:mycothiol synthase
MPRSDDPAPAGGPRAQAGPAPQVNTGGPVTESDASAVVGLADAAARADGVVPLSEHALLHVRRGGDARAGNLLLTVGAELAGYAHLDPAPELAPGTDEGPSAELVIHPAHRRRGLGLMLTRALMAQAGGGQPLRVWAHGDLPAAGRLAAAAGFSRARALWQMRRPLDQEIPAPQLAGGITVRAFVPGRDEDDWLALNARAFANHPEQGGWTREDIDLRELEPWFDPAGFFLAERAGKLAGFHWTKVHDEEPAGEVYVVGVDPAEQGTGLGRALTLIGLRYLRSRGLPEVLLYVDETNTSAIRLYESLGFTRTRTDAMFARTG